MSHPFEWGLEFLGAGQGSIYNSHSARQFIKDFNGEALWRFDHNEQIATKDGKMPWSVRQHHDLQREDFPAGYYSPGATPGREMGKTLLLTHKNHVQPKVAASLKSASSR